MEFEEQLRILEAAKGDAAKLALATVDLAYPALPETERAACKEALEAAAIPHWCDEAILAALLGISSEESAARLVRLRGLRVVEPFPARGDHAVNVHESARLALRKAMASDRRTQFIGLSARATGVFAANPAPVGRIEWIFHLLCSDPDRGADELESLDRCWSGGALPEDLYALASALSEIDAAKLGDGAARVEILLSIAETRNWRGETSRLEQQARDALALAMAVSRPSAQARANALLGDVLEAQGKLTEAQAAFGESLAIIRQLTEQDPTNPGWQRDLAVAQGRVGGVLEARGSSPRRKRPSGNTLGSAGG